MKKFTAFLTAALILVQMMVFTIVPVSAASERYLNGCELLAQMDMLLDLEEPKGEFDSVTRGEFVRILMNVMGLPDVADVSFDDIDNSHLYYGALATASQLGIVTGTETRADEAISYNEVVTMLVRALGYEDYAKAKGGYPMGYIAIARQYGMAKGVNLQGAATISYADAISLLSNSLEIEILKVAIFSESRIQYQVAQGETMLYAYQHLLAKEGLVTGTRNVSMVDTNIPKDFVRVDGYNYRAGFNGADDFVGQHVKFFYEPDSMTIRAMIGVENNILTIDAEAMVELDADTGEFEYWDDKSESYYGELSGDAVIMYNNVPIDSFNASLFEGKTGTFTFIDNNDDEVYDVAMLTVIETIVVSSANRITGMIYDKYSSNSVNMLESDDVTVNFVNELGEPVYLEELREGNVISVIRALDGSKITAVLSNTEVIGKVGGVVSQEGESTITIGDETFPALPAFLAYEDISIGDQGIFGMNDSGVVSSIDRSSGSGRKYAMLIATKEGVSTLEPEFSIKLFDQEGNIVATNFSKRVTIDGEIYTAQEAYVYMTLLIAYTSSLEQTKTPEEWEGIRTIETPDNPDNMRMVRYSTNNIGQVNWIDTINTTDVERAAGNDYIKILVEDYTHDTGDANRRFDTGFKAFEEGHISTANTVVFTVPMDVANADETKFTVENRDNALSTQNGRYPMALYGTDERGYVFEAMAIRSADASDAGTTLGGNVYIVEKVSEVPDPETGDEAVTKISVYGGQLYVRDEALLTNLKYNDDLSAVGEGLDTGDIIRVSKEYGSDFITAIQMVYNASDRTSYPYSNNANKREYQGMITTGEVDSVISGTNLLRMAHGPCDDTTYRFLTMISTNMTYVVCDLDNKEQPLRAGSMLDVVSWYTGLGENGVAQGEKGSWMFLYKTSTAYGTAVLYED